VTRDACADKRDAYVEYVAGSKHGLGRCCRSSSTSRYAPYVSCAVPAVEEVGCAVPQVEQVEQLRDLRGVCVCYEIKGGMALRGTDMAWRASHARP
jgi:hypothetical protein